MAEQPAARSGFAAQLHRLRLRAGLTQEALAEKAGLSVATIGAIEEAQRRRPYPHTLCALADSLDLSGTNDGRELSPDDRPAYWLGFRFDLGRPGPSRAPGTYVD